MHHSKISRSRTLDNEREAQSIDMLVYMYLPTDLIGRFGDGHKGCEKC